MKTVLVTGGAGFIGSHLVDFLLAREKCRIVVIDNFSTGSKENLREHEKDSHFTFVTGDIVDGIHLGDTAVHEIYNLACPASPVHYQANPIRTIKTNTIGVINVLGLAKKHGARVLQASTSEVYGDPLVHPQPETYFGNVNPMGPRSCYDEGKRIAEALFYEYAREHGVEIRVARIFNTYGPRMAKDDGRVVSNFVVQALSGKALTVEGDGTQTRSFCYVSDMVKGLHAFMASDYRGPVNLGNPDERTVFDLAENIIAMTRSRSMISFVPPAPGGPARRRPDIALAKRELGWEPNVLLGEGLKETIEDFRLRLGGKLSTRKPSPHI